MNKFIYYIVALFVILGGIFYFYFVYSSNTTIGPYVKVGDTLQITRAGVFPGEGDVKTIVDTTQPKITLSKWNGEVSMGVRLDGFTATSTEPLASKSVEWPQTNETMEAVPIEATTTMEDGGMEVNIHLAVKPTTNVFNFNLSNTDNLDFFYQAPLWQDAGLSGPTATCTDTDCTFNQMHGAHRPLNIVGSYSVYYKNHRDHIIGQTNYTTGKAFQIFRPLVTDARGASVWAIMAYANGVLSVTVPQTFLDTAVYPVIVDPTFGYTTCGSSTSGIYVIANVDAPAQYTASAGDVVTGFSFCGGEDGGIAGGATVDEGIYTYSSGAVGTLVGSVGTIAIDGTNPSPVWSSITVSIPLTAGVTYVVAHGHYTIANHTYPKYDSVGAWSVYSFTGSLAMPSTWSITANGTNNEDSMYATYINIPPHSDVKVRGGGSTGSTKIRGGGSGGTIFR